MTMDEPIEFWLLSQSFSGGPDYTNRGAYRTREEALAAYEKPSVVHPGAGRQERLGGVGWLLPDGTVAWKEADDGSIYTGDADISHWVIE